MTKKKNEFVFFLQPFDLSPEWKAMEKALQLPGSEIKKFERSNEYATIIADLGELFAINRTLTVEEIEAVYDMCRFDEAWNPHKRSIWCSVRKKKLVLKKTFKKNFFFDFRCCQSASSAFLSTKTIC